MGSPVPLPPPPVTPVAYEPPSDTNAPGWYHDPWSQAHWRWWDGHMWTVNTNTASERKPRLPSWLSVPVLVSAVLAIPLIALLAFIAPFSIPLGLVPILIVGPTLWWLDRVEPEPIPSRIHALLWGAFVAGVISVIINTIVSLVAGMTVAAVVSAPLVEEATKGLGVYWAVKRKEIDGVVDGIVYAGWVALGFAVVEDFSFFATAAGEGPGVLVATFVVRALITPFAHPLFTAWTGLGIGLAVARRKSVVGYGLAGYTVAVASHATWNGSLSIADSSDNGAIVVLVAALAFMMLFLVAAAAVVALRRRQQKRFGELVPFLANKYGIPQHEVAVFTDWRTMIATRKGLAGKPQKHMFDQLHIGLARLALLHETPGPVDPANESRLLRALQEARAELGW